MLTAFDAIRRLASELDEANLQNSSAFTIQAGAFSVYSFIWVGISFEL